MSEWGDLYGRIVTREEAIEIINNKKIHMDNFRKKELKKEMFNFWLDKPVPYCCRSCVPKQFQHDNQLYELELYGKVSKSFKSCPNYKGSNDENNLP